MENQQQLPCGLTQEKLNALVKEHGELKVVTVTHTTTEGLKTYQSVHREPSIEELDAFLTKSTKQPISAYVLLFNMTKVVADEVFNDTKQGQKLSYTAGRQLNAMFDDLEATIKNL